MKKRLVLICLSILFINFSCSEKDNACHDDWVIKKPEKTDDGWQISSLNSVNINHEKLQLLVTRICDSTYQNIHSILIVKDDKLVFEQYFTGYTFKYEADECKGRLTKFSANTLHNLASVTKSVTSILFGIAYNKGFINEVDDMLFKYFPEYSSLNDSLKNQITLIDALTMTTGFQWNEQSVSIMDNENDLIRLFYVKDPVHYILSKDVIHIPGTAFYYNGGNTNLLGEVIRKTSGLKLNDFAKKYLFDPLGIKQYKWIFFNPKMVYSSGDLKLRPRDMAKIGYLMLNNGIWNEKQILSASWIEQSTDEYVHFNDREGYGYQWWTKKYVLGNITFRLFTAIGWGGQRIMVIPDWNAVIIFTAGNYNSEDPIDEIMYRYILPSFNANFIYDYEIIKNEAPISESINIEEPDQDVSHDIAKLSGHWYGLGDFWIAGQLVVEQIDSVKASVLYAWGDHPDGYFERGWVRRSAMVDSSGQIEFSLYDATLTFKMDTKEDILIGYYQEGKARSKLIFNRR